MKCLMNAWHQYEPSVFTWLLARTENRQEAEDIMQDVFIKAMQNSERFCTLDDAKPWIFKMVRNHYIDKLRKRVDTEEVDDLSELFTTPSTTDSEIFVRMQQCLPPVLKQLKPDERRIIEACDLEGVRQAEYAEQNSMTLSAAKSQLQRARKALKRKLIEHCNVISVEQKVCCFSGEDKAK